MALGALGEQTPIPDGKNRFQPQRDSTIIVLLTLSQWLRRPLPSLFVQFQSQPKLVQTACRTSRDIAIYRRHSRQIRPTQARTCLSRVSWGKVGRSEQALGGQVQRPHHECCLHPQCYHADLRRRRYFCTTRCMSPLVTIE
jgi:hypothetical protein